MTRRGTSNTNERGSAEDRRRRKAWLVEAYRADVDVVVDLVNQPAWFTIRAGEWDRPDDGRYLVLPSCRCFRCGHPLTEGTVTVDRIVPGKLGGTYRRNNIRPACSRCNTELGIQLRVKLNGR